MAKTMNWLAAVGGLLTIVGQYLGTSWLVWVGGLAAIVFGAWSAMGK